MNRKMRRALASTRSQIESNNHRYAEEFEPIPRAFWPESNPLPTKVFRNRDFLVQMYEEGGGVKRLSICRTQVDSKGRWLEHITWEELQMIKRGVGFGDFDAVEIYPRDCDVVNVSNMRHLWVLEKPVAFAWRNVS